MSLWHWACALSSLGNVYWQAVCFFCSLCNGCYFPEKQNCTAKNDVAPCSAVVHPVCSVVFRSGIFFDKTLQSFLFVFAFWLCIIFGYNLTQNQKDWEYIFTGLSSLFLLCGTLTGVIAICQWLTIDAYIPGMVDMKRAARPYANFAQPNNMATFLAGLYLYEKKN